MHWAAKTTMLKATHIETNNRPPVLTLSTRVHSFVFNDLLNLGGGSSWIRGQEQGCCPSHVWGGHGGTGEDLRPTSQPGGENAHPWSPDVHTVTVVAKARLLLIGICGGDRHQSIDRSKARW